MYYPRQATPRSMMPVSCSSSSSSVQHARRVQPPADSSQLVGQVTSPLPHVRLAQPPPDAAHVLPGQNGSITSTGSPSKANVNLWLGVASLDGQQMAAGTGGQDGTGTPGRSTSCPPGGYEALLPRPSDQRATLERTLMLSENGTVVARPTPPGTPVMGGGNAASSVITAEQLAVRMRSKSPSSQQGGARAVRVRQHFRQVWTLEREERFLLQGPAP